MKLSQLKGLGPKSEKLLNEIGVYTKEDLEKIGAVNAFLALKKQGTVKPSLNFLYAMVGALQDEHWVNIAKTERARLIFELDDYESLKKMLKIEGIEW